MKYIRKSFFLFWLIAVMLFGTVSASAASAKPETPVLSGTAAGNRVTLNWNKVKKASGYQIFLYYKAYGKYKCVERIKNRNITSFTLTGSEDKLYTYKIRSYLKQGNKTLYSPSSKALEIKTAPGKPVITRIPGVLAPAEPDIPGALRVLLLPRAAAHRRSPDQMEKNQNCRRISDIPVRIRGQRI